MLLRLCSRNHVQPAIQRVVDRMDRQGFAEKDVFAMRLALEEALVNSLIHGNKSDPTKTVEVRCTVNCTEVEVQVQDQGQGFDPDAVPDPLAPENLERPCGRGLLLMRHYMTSVKYNDVGNCVTLVKEKG